MAETIISHYKVLKKLGEGGMGKVFLAEDTRLHRKVALKFLPRQMTTDPRIRERFQREAQTVAALNHPNIITVYDIGEYKGQIYIAMEHVEGESLRRYVDRKGLTVKQAVKIVLQTCEGLSNAHQVDIVHRDIKPENIMLGKDGRVRILDFGLAKLRGAGKLTKEGSTMGTVYYMSPEQALGKEVDQRSDIFSLGAVLYELVSGRHPFTGDSEPSVMYAIVHEEPKSVDNLPGALETVISLALQKDPDDRFQNLGDMAVALKKSLSQSIPKKAKQREPAELGTDSIEELLQRRQDIDRRIEKQFTKDVTILFSDIVGSTAFFERRGDLEGRAMLQRYTKTMVPIIERNSGKAIKNIGDGILASFGDPASGCQCSIEMQRAVQQANEELSQNDRIAIRIGIHYGRAVIEKEDVFGDVVNVASRIEHEAQTSEILVSDAVYRAVKDAPDLTLVSAGQESVKGKTDQIELYRLVWDEAEIENQKKMAAKELESAQFAEFQELFPEAKTEEGPVKILKPYKVEVPDKKEDEATITALKNPYINRVMIKNINEFYGRKSEVSKIFSRIGAPRPQSISIVGERRIGKSSLLNYIYQPQNRIKFLQRPNDYMFIFVDFQEKRGIQLPQFFESLYESFRREFKDGLVLETSPDYDGFKKLVTTLEKNKLSIIMLFDEFETITKNENIDAEFYSFFRSIANNHNVGYVVSSGRDLQSLCYSREIADSPFFNIFSNITLSQFSREEAIELIKEPSGKLGHSLEPHADLVMDMAGYYPFFIQMACSVLFEFVSNGKKITQESIDQVKEEFLDEAKVHFQQIWDICDDDERIALIHLASEQKVPDAQEYAVNNLRKAGYVKILNGRPFVFSSLFADFINARYASKARGGKRKKFIFW